MQKCDEIQRATKGVILGSTLDEAVCALRAASLPPLAGRYPYDRAGRSTLAAHNVAL